MTRSEARQAARKERYGYRITRVYIWRWAGTQDWHYGLRVPPGGVDVEEVQRE